MTDQKQQRLSLLPDERPKTNEEFAYYSLRNAIASGELAAGTRLVQTDWADRLQISTTPLREAIRRLQSEGLITSQPHRGVTVIGLNLDDAREIYQLRHLVEPLLLKASIAAFDEQTEARALEYCEQMDQVTDPTQFSELNRLFHCEMAHSSEGWTEKIADWLRAASAPYVSYSLHVDQVRMHDSNQDHYELVSAYRHRNIALAEEIMARHLDTSLAILEKHLPEKTATPATSPS